MIMESPTIDFTFDQWMCYHWSRLSTIEDDTVGKHPVSPYQVMELERNAARSENKALKLELQQLHQQATQSIQQLSSSYAQLRLFLGAVVHSMGGKLLVPHASLDALRKDPHRMTENIDNDLKVTAIEVMQVDPNEQPEPAEAASEVSEESVAAPLARPLIELVSR